MAEDNTETKETAKQEPSLYHQLMDTARSYAEARGKLAIGGIPRIPRENLEKEVRLAYDGIISKLATTVWEQRGQESVAELLNEAIYRMAIGSKNPDFQERAITSDVACKMAELFNKPQPQE